MKSSDCRLPVFSLLLTFAYCFPSPMAFAFLITEYQLQDLRGGGRIWRTSMKPIAYLLCRACCLNSNAQMLASGRQGLILRNLTLFSSVFLCSQIGFCTEEDHCLKNFVYLIKVNLLPDLIQGCSNLKQSLCRLVHVLQLQDCALGLNITP